MFTEFTPLKASLFKERVNTWLGIVFLATVALWMSMLVWNFAEGTTPIDRAISSALDASARE
jgi:hypothetical protein